MILNRLSKFSNTFRSFGKFYKDNYGDILVFVKLPFQQQVGVFIHFLADNGIGFHADKYSYVIFYMNLELQNVKEKISTLMKVSNTIFIAEEYYDQPKELFSNYEDAIVKAFAFIEKPF